MHGREPERVEPPAREPDEIEAWSAKASTAPIDEKGDTRYESDPRCRGTEYSRYVLCRSEIEEAVAIMRRHRDELRAAIADRQRAEEIQGELAAELAALRDERDEAIRLAEERRKTCQSLSKKVFAAEDGLRKAHSAFAEKLALRAAKPAPTSERVQTLRAKLEKAIDGLVGESLTPSGNSGNSDLDRLPLYDANREVEHYVDELCELASNPIRVAEPAGDGALRKAAKAVVDEIERMIQARSSPVIHLHKDMATQLLLEPLRAALAAQEPAEESDLVRTNMVLADSPDAMLRECMEALRQEKEKP